MYMYIIAVINAVLEINRYILYYICALCVTTIELQGNPQYTSQMFLNTYVNKY